MLETCNTIEVLNLQQNEIEVHDLQAIEEVVVSEIGQRGEDGAQGDKGDKGDKGDQGIAGPSGSSYDFVQAVPATVWTINHNLGYTPLVQAFNSGSQLVECEVVHISLNITMIYFNYNISGFARLV